MIARITQIAEKALQDESTACAVDWYHDARLWLAELDSEHGLEPGTSAGVTAALSPLSSWDIQQRDIPRIIRAAIPLLAYGASPLPAIIGPGFYSNKRKAVRILQGECPLQVLSGDKVTRFYRNLTGDLDCVTVDRHAVSVAGWNKSLTSRAYRRIEQAYKFAAENVGLFPAEVQSVTWEYWRKHRAA